MNLQYTLLEIPFCIVVAVGIIGCGSDSSQPSTASHGTQTAGPPATVATGHDDHAHPSEGPHGGSLVELGNEEYHAEIVHDDATHTVTVYLLDSAAKKLVPLYATEILVNLSHDGKAEQFALKASPQSSDPAGKSSRFASTEEELAEDLDHEDVKAQLAVEIGGKQYRGEIHHDHGEASHEGHKH
ncbi:hypothetical protein [Bythopirellula goksoeyrii]|uniref:Uncharacterized protein n=1 Tax=Bythopirellula goksoeyrii TaxID=1400387 RepID=A0A5B9QE12_9BACT|nr:hypothetical protein [Bythopirellula goksoeyrii]QEG35870.1 hypothetical protein Pr1d_31760 [Bythopirellula goksoeyrii]